MAVKADICPNCFQTVGKAKKCLRCGYDSFERKNLLALPLNAILKKRYVAGRILGAGGFGITYKAYDTKNKCLCAVKEYVPLGYANRLDDGMMLTATSSEKEEIFSHGKRKFIDEANILSKLHYISSVVEVRDCFAENGTAYFIMEFLDGVTLNQLRGSCGGTIPFKHVYEIVHNVGKCLHEVHTKANIFHRDISPENIMIGQNGQVKVIDFGTAKNIHGQKSQNLSVVLKPGFAPPEQYSSTSKQGEFTDVYALAATMYYVLCGQKIPAAPDRLAGGAVVEPIHKLLGDAYQPLSEILNHALQMKVSERTPTMACFLSDLETYKKEWDKMVGDEEKTDSGNGVTVVPIGSEEEHKTEISKQTKRTTVEEIIEPDAIKPPEQRPPSYCIRPYLDGVVGPVKGYRYPIPVNTMITVGRSRSNSITINLNVIGRKHMEMFYDTYNGLFFIVDNSSVNGTYVNGIKCLPSVITPVKAGSLLSLAQNSCVFQLGTDIIYTD